MLSKVCKVEEGSGRRVFEGEVDDILRGWVGEARGAASACIFAVQSTQ